MNMDAREAKQPGEYVTLNLDILHAFDRDVAMLDIQYALAYNDLFRRNPVPKSDVLQDDRRENENRDERDVQQRHVDIRAAAKHGQQEQYHGGNAEHGPVNQRQRVQPARLTVFIDINQTRPSRQTVFSRM